MAYTTEEVLMIISDEEEALEGRIWPLLIILASFSIFTFVPVNCNCLLLPT